MKVQEAIQLIQIFLSVGIVVQTLEYFSLRKQFSDAGIWQWSEMREEFSYLHYFDFVLSKKAFPLLLGLRLMAALILPFWFSLTLLLFLFLSTLLISIRFRGSFNGGSDYMTAIVLSALCVAAIFPQGKIITGALWYIALQSVTSYFLAGLVKIKQPLWRSGEALRAFIHSPNYNPPIMVKTLLQNRSVAFGAAWIVMIAELLFPLVLLMPPPYALVAIAGAFLFHLNNVVLFGLNRFLLAWLTTYPAIYFVVNNFSNSP